MLDRLAMKKIIHKNKASRYKSRLSLKINNLSSI
ncbi:30S ribosomal protein S20 [Buchnera aphidicola]|nr:30S ribosomal protein S20 [Buchnera aphidicola (Stegophylla sp.)]MCW5197370.1 30S ribosomal protein S20 [Buchnera aphidicola (Stegophylla sp.)]